MSSIVLDLRVCSVLVCHKRITFDRSFQDRHFPVQMLCLLKKHSLFRTILDLAYPTNLDVAGLCLQTDPLRDVKKMLVLSTCSSRLAVVFGSVHSQTDYL
jgi:hypothetical protein